MSKPTPRRRPALLEVITIQAGRIAEPAATERVCSLLLSLWSDSQEEPKFSSCRITSSSSWSVPCMRRMHRLCVQSYTLCFSPGKCRLILHILFPDCLAVLPVAKIWEWFFMWEIRAPRTIHGMIIICIYQLYTCSELLRIPSANIHKTKNLTPSTEYMLQLNLHATWTMSWLFTSNDESHE